jgi:hypothetical protein
VTREDSHTAPVRKVVLCYVAMIAASASATYLAYNGPLSSDAWRNWSTEKAWLRDTLRAAVSAAFALFMLWNLTGAPRRQLDRRSDLRMLGFRRGEWWLLGIFAVLLIAMAFYWLPHAFIEGLIARGDRGPWSFSRIWKPYIPYLFYILILWIGIASPVLVCLIRNIRLDWKWWKTAREPLNHACRRLETAAPASIEDLEGLERTFQDYVIDLKNLGERYVPVVLAVCLVLLYEQITTSKETVTPLAVDIGKVALWLLLGPTLIIFIFSVALGYQSSARKVDAVYQKSVGLIAKAASKKGVAEKLLTARKDLMWDHTPAAFVLTVVKSASVSITLLLAVTIYVLNTIAGPEGWLGVFVPRPMVEFIKRVYDMPSSPFTGAVPIPIEFDAQLQGSDAWHAGENPPLVVTEILRAVALKTAQDDEWLHIEVTQSNLPYQHIDDLWLSRHHIGRYSLHARVRSVALASGTVRGVTNLNGTARINVVAAHTNANEAGKRMLVIEYKINGEQAGSVVYSRGKVAVPCPAGW